MTVVLYGIPNCDQVKKARMWLTANAQPHVFHDFKKSGISRPLVEDWLRSTHWELLVNRKGTTWRALDDDRKAAIVDADAAIELMLEAPSVIKRPVLSIDGEIHVGFSEPNYQLIFKK